MSRSSNFWVTNPEVWDIAALEDLDEVASQDVAALDLSSKADIKAFLRSLNRNGGYNDSLTR